MARTRLFFSSKNAPNCAFQAEIETTNSLLASLDNETELVISELLKINKSNQSFIPSFLKLTDIQVQASKYADILNALWPVFNEWQKYVLVKDLSQNVYAYLVLAHVEKQIFSRFSYSCITGYIDNFMSILPAVEFSLHVQDAWPVMFKNNVAILADLIWKKPEFLLELLLNIKPENQSIITIPFLREGLRESINNEISIPIFSALIPILNVQAKHEIFETLLFCNKSKMPYLEIVNAIVNNIATSDNAGEILIDLYSVCIKTFNIYYFYTLMKDSSPLLQWFSASLFSDNQMHVFDYALGDEFSIAEKLYLSSIMPQFYFKADVDYSFGMEYKMGKSLRSGSLFTLAQTSARKSYPLTCTVVRPTELEDLFTILKSAKKCLREKIIFSGFHWMAAEIWIEGPNKASLLLLDALGQETEYLPGDIEYLFSQYFPEGTVYLAKDMRQRSSSECAIYSLDDCIHLFTVESYLDAKYQTSGLLGYIKDNARESWGEASNIHLVKLPLRFLLTMQSRSIYKKIKLGTDNQLPVNKKGELIQAVLDREFVDKRNLRVQRKMAKMAEYNLNYFFSHPDLKKLANGEEQSPFTLDGLRLRYASSRN